MIKWQNLDTLRAFGKLTALKKRVNLPEAMAGENGAARVAAYSVPMGCGLSYNYAAKAVDDEILSVLEELAAEAQLTEKYAALYNGEMINTGEKRLVLHQLTRGQLGEPVIADGVDKRAFYAAEQKKAAAFAERFTQARSPTPQAKSSRRSCRSASAAVTSAPAPCIWRWKTGPDRTAASIWRPVSSAT